MQRSIVTFAALVMLAASSLPAAPARAQDRFATDRLNTGWYGGLSAGWLLPRDADGPSGVTLEMDDGYLLLGAAGYRFGSGLRLEGELGYGNAGYDSLGIGGTSIGQNGDVDFYSATGAAYHDIATTTALTPYFGVGGGLMHQRGGTVSGSAGGIAFTADRDSMTDLTAFGEAGVNYRIGEKIDLVPAYRYQWIDDGEDGLDDTEAHIFKVGLRYWFN